MARDKDYKKVVHTPKAGMKKKIHNMIEALIDGKSDDANAALRDYLRVKTQAIMNETKNGDKMKNGEKDYKEDADDEDVDDEDEDKEDADTDDEDVDDEDEDKEDEDTDDEDVDDDDEDEDKEDELTEGHKKVRFSKKGHHNAGLKLKRIGVKK